MLESVETLIERSANGGNSLFIRQPQILSASLKMLAATRGYIGTCDDTSALQHIENYLKKEETCPGFLSSASSGDDSNASQVSAEQLCVLLNHKLEHIVTIASSFSEAITNHHSLITRGGDLDGRRDVGQFANRTLDYFDVKDCVDAEKYLGDLFMTDDFVRVIQTRDKDINAIRSNIAKFAELHIEKEDCIRLLQEASPLV